MDTVINLYKPVGYTPLQLIKQFIKIKPEYEKSTLGYAGRLDPMADGVLLILVDEENKKRKEYELLPKKYIFKVLFGVETDSYDIMGIIQSQKTTKSVQLSDIQNVIKKFIGTWEQPYPPYSSPRVNGKPLFYWARNNMLSTIDIPKKEVTVNNFELITMDTITPMDLFTHIHSRISLVSGDFRQKEIVQKWRKILEDTSNSFSYMTCSIQCSSGLYVRSIAQTIGTQLGTGALALEITRTAVGEYLIDSALRLTDTS
ncbi:hypothetical protein BH09PAT2_BH09PAT2_09960 [soil metagenome]